MSDWIVVLPSTGLADATVLVAERTGAGVAARRMAVAEAAALVGPGHTAVLPGQLVRAMDTDMPGSVRGAERATVARFAHEDRLATDPAELHVVVGSGSPAPTALVASEVVAGVVALLDPARIVSDFDALAALDEPTHLLDRVVVPGAVGHALDPDWVDAPAAQLSDEALAEALFARLDAGEALNLRSGPFRRRRVVATGPWLRIAAAFVGCALLGLSIAAVEARAVAAQADGLEADARALYQSATGQPAPARLSALARNAAPDAAANAVFLDLSQTLFAAVAATPGTRVERLSFEADEGVVRLRLIYPGFDAAGALERAVEERGAQLTTGGVREQNGVFIGDAALGGAPS